MSKYNATIDAIKGFDRILPEESQFYRSYKRSVNNVNVIDLINILSSVNVCCGISVNEVTNKVIYHVLQVEIVENDEEIQICLKYIKKILLVWYLLWIYSHVKNVLYL